MRDCFNIKQGMIFWVDDLSTEESVLFHGETTPKKRRPWVIISNDTCNNSCKTVTAVPVYTHNGTTRPTQVCFDWDGKTRAILCENVTSIPKTLIDNRGYAGFLSPKIFKQVQAAMITQISSSYEYEEITNAINNSVNIILQSMDMKSIVMERICDMLTGANRYSANITTESTEVNAAPLNTVHNQVSNVLNTTREEESIVNIPKRSCSEKSSCEDDVTVPKKHHNYPKSRKVGSRRMSIEQTMEFYLDFAKCSPDELHQKWKEYGITADRTYQSKRKYVAKQRLEKEGLL